MSDVICPYCRREQEICHDDGYGFEEDGEFEQECSFCDGTFKFTTSISYNYNVCCNDEKDHVMENCYKDLWECTKCDHYEVRKEPTS